MATNLLILDGNKMFFFYSRNEVEFYNKIFPELLKFQQKKTNEALKAIPHCYLARNDLVILEDLRVRKFEMPNRQEGLTFEQTMAVLKELARFHSLSLSYKVLNIQIIQISGS